MRIGTDLVHIPKFEKVMNDPDALRRVFTEEEIVDRTESMAGKFAAKEAYFKALGKKGDWHEVQVLKKESGEPYLICEHEKTARVSISHDGDYALAFVVIE